VRFSLGSLRARPGGTRRGTSKPVDSVRLGAGAPLDRRTRSDPSEGLVSRSTRDRETTITSPRRWNRCRRYERWLRKFDSSRGDCREGGHSSRPRLITLATPVQHGPCSRRSRSERASFHMRQREGATPSTGTRGYLEGAGPLQGLARGSIPRPRTTGGVSKLGVSSTRPYKRATHGAPPTPSTRDE